MRIDKAEWDDGTNTYHLMHGRKHIISYSDETKAFHPGGWPLAYVLMRIVVFAILGALLFMK